MTSSFVYYSIQFRFQRLQLLYTMVYKFVHYSIQSGLKDDESFIFDIISQPGKQCVSPHPDMNLSMLENDDNNILKYFRYNISQYLKKSVWRKLL